MDHQSLDDPQAAPAQLAAQLPLGIIWPQVIGGISFVVGILACINGGFSVISNIVSYLSAIGFRNPPAGGSGLWLPQGLMTYSLQTFARVLPNVLLIFAGLRLYRLSPAGRTLHLVYGFGAIVLTAAGWGLSGLLGYPVNTNPLYMVYMIPSLVYPVFTLIWFFKPTIRSEVAAWRQARDLSPFGHEL